MRRFTVFTFLYLAAGICLTAIALQSPDIALRSKVSLLINAGLFYLFAVFSTYPFWRRSVLRQNRRSDQPTWRQQLRTVAPWLLIAASLLSSIVIVQTEHGTNHAITQVVPMLAIVLLGIEQILVRNQTLQ
ncbi:MAG: hypothetical protein ACAF41_01370 [Leptolyngbya sp. BL-A-14]